MELKLTTMLVYLSKKEQLITETSVACVMIIWINPVAGYWDKSLERSGWDAVKNHITLPLKLPSITRFNEPWNGRDWYFLQFGLSRGGWLLGQHPGMALYSCTLVSARVYGSNKLTKLVNRRGGSLQSGCLSVQSTAWLVELIKDHFPRL